MVPRLFESAADRRPMQAARTFTNELGGGVDGIGYGVRICISCNRPPERVASYRMKSHGVPQYGVLARGTAKSRHQRCSTRAHPQRAPCEFTKAVWKRETAWVSNSAVSADQPQQISSRRRSALVYGVFVLHTFTEPRYILIYNTIQGEKANGGIS